MNYRSRWAWIAVLTLVLALTGAWLTTEAGFGIALLTTPRH